MAVSETLISDKIEETSIKEQLEKEIEGNEIAYAENYSHKEDLEKLLKLAEELKEKCDSISNRIVRVRFLQFTLVLCFITYLFFGYYITKESVDRERVRARQDNLLLHNELLKDLNRQRDNLNDKLKYSDREYSKEYSNKSEQSEYVKRLSADIDNIDLEITQTKNAINNLRNSPIQELPFSEFFLMYDRTIPPILILFVGLFISFFLVASYKKKISPEKTALSEVLQLLRETSNIIAKQENWSVLSRAEFNIRLSRFNLEEKSKSAFNFFS